MNNIALLTRLSLALSVLLLAAYALNWSQVDIRKADFAAFYSASRLHATNQPVYDVPRQCAEQIHVGATLCLPFVRPPLELPLLSAVVSESYRISYWRWAILMLAVFALCGLPLSSLTGNDWLKTLAVLVSYPVFQSLLLGQDSALILFSVLMFALCLKTKRDFVAGLALSLICLKPHLAIALALPLLFVRSKAFVGFCVGGLALVVVSYFLVGFDGLRQLVEASQMVAQGGYGANSWAMPNIRGLIVRLGLPDALGFPVYVIGIAAISLLWRKYGTGLISLSLGIVVALLTVPHVHVHDLVLLIVPAIFLPVISIPLLSVVLIAAQAGEFLSWVGFATLLGFAASLLLQLRSVKLDTKPVQKKAVQVI